MKNPLVPKFIRHFVCISGVFASATVASASIPATSFQFGTVPERVDPLASGFVVHGADKVDTRLMAHAFQMAVTGKGFVSHAFLRPYPGLGGMSRNNFSATLAATIMDFSGHHNRRFGMTLFGVEDLRRGGIFAGVTLDRNVGQQIMIRAGHDGDILASAIIPGGTFNQGDIYELEVEGTFSEELLTLTLTVTRGVVSAEVATTVNAAHYTGNLFGGGGRQRAGWVVDYSRFELSGE